MDLVNKDNDFNVLLEHKNTFAISTSIDDVLTANGRGGTLTCENHRVIIMKAHIHKNGTTVLALAKTEAELNWTDIGTGLDRPWITQHKTPLGNTVYAAIVGSMWVHTESDFNIDADYNCMATVDGVEKKFNYAVQCMDGNTMPRSVLNLADFLLYIFL